MRFGYGSNGFPNHRLEDALAVIADLGYQGVALTLDHAHLDPFAPDLPGRVTALSRRLNDLGLAVVVETGARYLLDPRRKHEPTLVSDRGRDRRVAFLRTAVDVAADLGAEAVSFWSGIRPAHVPEQDAWEWLAAGCSAVLETAERRGVPLGFEPEPGMLVHDLDGYERLHALLGRPEAFGLTLDIGHCRCNEPLPVADCVRRAGDRIVNVQIDDMRRGVHEHLEFGEGEIGFPPVLAALAETGYRGLVAVELPRHGHDAPRVAERSLAFLQHAAAEAAAAAEPRPERERATLEQVRAVLVERLSVGAAAWLHESCALVARDPDVLARRFPAAGRRCGRGPLGSPVPALDGWTVDDAVRAVLLGALPADGADLAAEAGGVYHHGDAAEKRGVLRALDVLGTGPDAVPLVRDALRSNDTRLIAAALGAFAAEHLDGDAWRHGVLKCVFLGMPLATVAGLDLRADAELNRMLRDLARERMAAGRPVPDDVRLVLARLDQVT
ncbi:EboA domain-containing protein [Spirillospora sp. NPDC047279]|uniref:EboA domain-containing protein n=1 Tax=Spirillospora sp. NPDC047279 TaxID=3155478 RepID=UPI0033D5428F